MRFNVYRFISGNSVLGSLYLTPSSLRALSNIISKRDVKNIMEKLLVEKTETKVCSKCGRTLPIEKFRLLKGKFYTPYYLGECKECEYKYQREYLEKKNKITFSDNIEMLIQRKYKEIKNERILDISGLSIVPLGTDETFVKLMDYKNI